MDTFGSRLRRARKHKRLSQTALGDKIGVTQGAISQAELDSTTDSRHSLAMAHALGVSPRWLADGIGEMLVQPTLAESSNFEPGPEIRGRVPIITWVQAGRWSTICHDGSFEGIDRESLEYVNCPTGHSMCTFALRVRGDSMFNPHGKHSYMDGDVIFVDPDREAINGSRVVARVDDRDEATFKQLVIEDGIQRLKALNPDWQPRYVPIDGPIVLAGVVIGTWRPE